MRKLEGLNTYSCPTLQLVPVSYNIYLSAQAILPRREFLAYFQVSMETANHSLGKGPIHLLPLDIRQ